MRFACTTPDPCLLCSVIVSTACWGMVRCQRVQFGRPCHLPPTTNSTTWWPSWTSTVWAKVIQLPCSITWKNIRNAVKLLGKNSYCLWTYRVYLLYMLEFVDLSKIDDLSYVVVYSWHAIIVDGHSVEELCKALSQPRHQPTAIIAKTIKGKGIPGKCHSPLLISKWITLSVYCKGA